VFVDLNLEKTTDAAILDHHAQQARIEVDNTSIISAYTHPSRRAAVVAHHLVTIEFKSKANVWHRRFCFVSLYWIYTNPKLRPTDLRRIYQSAHVLAPRFELRGGRASSLVKGSRLDQAERRHILAPEPPVLTQTWTEATISKQPRRPSHESLKLDPRARSRGRARVGQEAQNAVQPFVHTGAE